MRDFIITTIVALAAAKAKAQGQDKLDNQKGREKQEHKEQFEGTREGADYRVGHRVNFQ